MRYFTGNPVERMMMEIPRPAPGAEQKDIPEQDHPCYGCKHYGEVCALPCYRDVTRILASRPAQP